MRRNFITPGQICAVDSCDRPARKLGMCVKHYERLRNHGDVNYRQWDAVTPEMRFWRKVKKSDDPNGCWSWTGSTSPLGYGQTWVKDRLVLTHRFSYELHKGPIPDGLVLDHICCNPNCCNPDHLEPVTQAENVRRALTKTHCKRGHELSGENVVWHKRPNRPATRECRACVSGRRHKPKDEAA